MENLTSRLLLEEMRNNESEEKGSVGAFKSAERKYNKCNEKGHVARFCKENRRESSNKKNAVSVVTNQDILRRIVRNQEDLKKEICFVKFARKIITREMTVTFVTET